MENLSANLAKSVLESLKPKLVAFSNEVVKACDGKVTQQQVLDLWNSVSDCKVTPADVAVPAAPKSVEAKKKSSSKKKSDTGSGCSFLLTRGDNRGKPCDDKTVSGSVYCSRHKKMVEGDKGAKAAPAPKKGGKAAKKAAVEETEVSEEEEEEETEELDD